MQCLGWIFLCGLLPLRSFAVTYDLPSAGNTLVGHLQYTQSHYNDSVAVLAQQYDVGLNALIDANPGVDPLRRLGSGVFLTIPTQYLLPDEHHGIVVNLPEMRLYYFPTNANIVMTYPIGVGKIGKSVPVTRTAVARKTTDPTWIPPEDIREFNREQGIELPKVMPPGPDNPLGHYAIYLKLPTYLIHSTIFPDSVGKRASFGCVRMHEADVKELFSLVDRGLPVSIVNIPVKAGWNNNRLYLEAHPALEEFPTTTNSLVGMVNLVGNTVQKQSQLVLIDWQLVAFLHEERDGMPHEVGMVV
ncbi:MAG: hypothetical protein A3E83_00190 [Gammaproteobacteria bacterium RIFCSPHIGHO2_12_FULL_41_20]|nr:MAG: hypothetical protein A3E83_00190 [Gammaproteobacteria bacterium RIFCSPHIGHO2_12_FULL_41_20]